MTAAAFFDAARALKRELTGEPTVGLTQAEVDELNAVVTKWNPAPAVPCDIPDDYWPMLARIESGNRPYIKARTSSASGLYQFIKSTWLGEGGQWGPDPSKAFGGLMPSEAEQIQRAKSFTQKNADYLKRKGLPVNRASLYACHFFGPVTAAKVIAADVNKRADHIAGAAATNANPSILRNKTVGQFLGWLHVKTGQWAR